MKTAFALPLALFAASPLLQADTFLEIESPEDFGFYDWNDEFIWFDGVPTAECTATLTAQEGFDGDEDDPFGTEVIIFVDSPVSVGSLEMEFSGVEIDVNNTTFDVSGTSGGLDGSDNMGFLSVRNGRASLGTVIGYDAATKTFNGGSGFAVSSEGTPDFSILEWRGADIEIIEGGGFNLNGPNSVVRDQNTGLDALRNLRQLDGGFLSIRYGHDFQTSGNLTNNSFIGVGANVSPTAPAYLRVPTQLNIAGNLINNDDIYLRGGAVLNVAGGLSGTGEIRVLSDDTQISVVGSYSQTGGRVMLGDSPPSPPSGPDCSVGRCDSFWLKAVAQLYNGSTISGNGTLIGAVTINAGNFRPGNSPGRINITGDLTLDTTTEIEVGGTEPGTGHDWVFQEGGDNGVTLGGTLELSLLEDFRCEITGSDSFEVMSSDLPISGSFANVASGARLDTTDGLGSFQVDYTGSNAVTLSNFIANITPEPFEDWVTRFDLQAGDDGPLDDPNRDGISNLEAYFRGIAPVGATKVLPIALSGNSATIVSPKSVTGVIVSSEVSPDLSAWDAGPEPTVIGGTSFTNTYGFEVPAGDRQFLRFGFSDQIGIAQ